MNSLRLYFPSKPFQITQAWGIYNPAYLQFGFSKHNGTDFTRGIPGEKTWKLYWPADDFEIYDTSFGNGTGWNIRGYSNQKYDFPDGKSCKVQICVLHMDHQSPIKTGTTLNAGDYIGDADNTGFSTGPHTHLLVRRVDDNYNPVDINEANNTIDPMLYMTSFYAEDVGTILQTLREALQLLKDALSKH